MGEYHPHFSDEVTEFKVTQLASIGRVGDFNASLCESKALRSIALFLSQIALRVKDGMGAVLGKLLNLDSELLYVSGNPLEESCALGLCSTKRGFQILAYLLWPQVDTLEIW